MNFLVFLLVIYIFVAINTKNINKMKKIFLFLSATALVLSLNSCSSDDDGGGSSVSFKVDGVSKSFKVVSEDFGGILFVTGYKGSVSNPTEFVSFTIESGATGAGAISDFSYESTTESYDATTLTSDVSENANGKVKGTFSGTLEPFEGGSDVIITDGKFSAKY
jgi:hypothetical protein